MAEFSALAKDYQNFLTPAMNIKIDGKDIQTTYKVGVPNATIKLSMDEAGSVDFTVVNIYDLKNSKIADDVSKNIKVGIVISVELGYGSKLKEVFKGFISSISYDFSGMPSMSVTAHDARRLMMKNVRKGYEYTETKYSEVAKKIFGAYKAVCSKQDVKITDAVVNSIKQNTSDYKFITDDIGKKGNREFFIVGDTFYFRDFSEEKETVVTLERGKGLISFNSKKTYEYKEITIYGHDVQKNEVLVAKKTVKTDGDTPALVTSDSPAGLVQDIQRPDADDADKAAQMLDYEADEELQKAHTGSGTCIGIPDIVPGKYIKIDNLDKSVNNTYYLQQVTHNFGEDGYTTEFELGGILKNGAS